MDQVGVGQQNLDDVIFSVSRDYVEEKAMAGAIEELDQRLVDEVIQDVVFIVERYMYYINELMDKQRLEALK